MPRPKKLRFIDRTVVCQGFIPDSKSVSGVSELPLEGFEAIRLSDCEGCSHEQAAEKMGVSRQTFGRILAGARRVIAEALVDGKRLVVMDGPCCVDARSGRRRRFRRRGGC